jgi:hypothetical protein
MARMWDITIYTKYVKQNNIGGHPPELPASLPGSNLQRDLFVFLLNQDTSHVETVPTVAFAQGIGYAWTSVITSFRPVRVS